MMSFLGISFNPRTRVGCDKPCRSSTTGASGFQSTHPRGVRPGTAATSARFVQGFNPRTRVGCDLSDFKDMFTFRSFNPRTRVGCDKCAGCGLGDGEGFNPRTRVGCDLKLNSSTDKHILFQSTHPRGVRPDRRSSAPDVETVSIHAPAWGATTVFDRVRMMLEVSIHAPAWGATRGNYGIHQRKRAGFNPRTRVGCDADGFSVKPTTKLVSIHAPAWGATACCMSCAAWV